MTGNLISAIILKIGLLLCLFLLVFGLLTSCVNQKFDSEKIIGVKIYEYSGDITTLFVEWTQLGINTVFVSPSLDSIPSFREEALKHQIKRFLIIPTFFDPNALKNNPELYAITDRGKPAKEEWVEFVCPNKTEYRQKKIAYIENLIKDLDPDGISIDFIRYFAFWEKIYPDRSPLSLSNTCFDKTCLDKFQNDIGIKIPKSVHGSEEIAAWILKNYGDEWTNWKCHTITSMVKEIADVARMVKPSIKINLHAVPWRSNDYNGAIKTVIGQNLVDLGSYVDFISPMCYHHMLKRETSWIHDVITDFFEQTHNQILPSIQVSKAYLQNDLTVEEFEGAIKQSLKIPSAGVVFWNWDAIAASPAKKAIIHRYFKGNIEI
ncbi:hypothetical protein AMJ80_00270 [bacterium SM23_31]|nr:MAG: hypothetical protein AMJ80_00270 [bacterium SM23_31]